MCHKTQRPETLIQKGGVTALGVDVGYKRYGFALGYDARVIIPLYVRKVKNGVLPAEVLDDLMFKYPLTHFVIGINDDERAVPYIQALSYNLAKVCRIRYAHSQVVMVSERYTSYYAELDRDKGQCYDHKAAAIILANWFDIQKDNN